jgi:Leu/Phe-tRNA-protein transferase
MSLFLGLYFLLAWQVQAEETTSRSKACEAKLSALGLPQRTSGIGTRGLLGYLPNASPEIEASLGEGGVINWYTKVFAVESVEAALAQEKISLVAADLAKDPEKRFPNEHLRALYVISPGLKVTVAMTDEARLELANIVVNQPVYEVKNNELVQIDPQLVAERFNTKTMTTIEQFPAEGVHMRFWGWHFANPYGIFVLKEMRATDLGIIKGSGTIGKLEAKARAAIYPIAIKGVPAMSRLKVTFNKDLEGVMRGAGDQERSGQSKAANRISEAMISEFLELQKRGNTISVEVWQETQSQDGSLQRTLIGGIFGMNVGGLISIDSVFYPPGNPDIARIAMLAFRDRLEAVGIEFSPAVMISSWSQSMRGRLVSGEEAQALIDNRKLDVHPDFESEWKPIASEEFTKRPFGLQRKN